VNVKAGLDFGDLTIFFILQKITIFDKIHMPVSVLGSCDQYDIKCKITQDMLMENLVNNGFQNALKTLKEGHK